MRSTARVVFDDSLRVFVSVLETQLGASPVQKGLILRDVEGRLAFVAPAPMSDEQRVRAEAALTERLGPYARGGGRTVLAPDAPGAERWLASPEARPERVHTDNGEAVEVRVLDRRAAGGDWMSEPAAPWKTPPARMVFASMKGGVGRSTALAVLAVDLSRTRNVLVVDLDLEAPGLGQMLIADADRPRFGALDWYMESSLQAVEPAFLEEMVAPSRLRAGNGLIDVVPALGTSADEHPANVLAKLSRAYLGGVDEQGATTFLQQTRKLIDNLVVRSQYDAVLVDARAGLNETTAAAILGLGADVLLFGVDTPQTFAAHRYLLAHLSRFPSEPYTEHDWLPCLKVVHAKAAADPVAQQRFRDNAFRAFDEFLYRDVPMETNDEASAPLTRREFGLEDREAPHHAWVVLSDANYFQFDPLSEPSHVNESVYRPSFDGFVKAARERMGLEKGR